MQNLSGLQKIYLPMNTSMIIISVLLVMAVVVPFLIFNFLGKGDSKIISNKVKQFSKEAHLKLDEKESWGNTFIAIDRTQKILVFSKIIKGEVTIKNIALDQVEKTNIQKNLKLVKTNTGKENVLQRLDLEIVFFAHHEKSLLLNFYDVDQVYTENYELKRAEKWSTLINEVVKTSPMGRVTA